ncbi:hypothetical protein [Niallia sp. 03190]|uniref:hypothetical protein n=1 Tax=Niallia sp. 03190 TaxID=3458061 RepID=UPI0040446D57
MYTNGNCGVTYIVKGGNDTVDQSTDYGEGNVYINFELNGIGQSMKLLAKNVYKGVSDAVKVVGKWFD